MTQIYYDSKHPLDKDVIEFFASIVHHSSKSTYNTAYKACLHNPVQDIQQFAECVKGDRMSWTNGLIYCYGISSVLVFPIEKNTVQNLLLEAFDQKRH